jgi:dipeptidyl aminopeptidase/acylaminoacyl peptidase
LAGSDRPQGRRNSSFVFAVVVIGVAIYAGVGRADSQHVRSSVRNGPLTLFVGPVNGVAEVDAVGPGKSRTLWHCPGGNFCGQPVSFDWAPDGRRVAFTLDEIGGNSPYVGLHVVDVVSKRDAHVPAGAPSDTSRSSWGPYLEKMLSRIGCFPAPELAWSPDGASLAYSCGRINVLKLNGAGHSTIPTPTNASWPSWSPGGNRIAYSTRVRPNSESKIYTVALDGSHLHLIATRGAAPAWSPSGRVIAYQSQCGIRLVTPAGRDVTPRHSANSCGALALAGGPPVWSPDGKQLALETEGGIFVMKADGGHLRLLTGKATTTWYGRLPGRPAWRSIH